MMLDPQRPHEPGPVLVAEGTPPDLAADNPPISCYIRTKNESRMVAQVVDAAFRIVREVVVLDSGSEDDTVEIAAAHGARVFHHDWEGWGRQKRIAQSLCREPYVLDLDTDEIITHELANEIRTIFAERDPTAEVFALKLTVTPPGQEPWIECRPSLRAKLYDARVYQQPDSGAWDQLDLPPDHPIQVLEAPLPHYNHPDLGWLLAKVEGNMRLQAAHTPLKAKWYVVLRILFGLPVYFLKFYFLRRMFLKGVYGFCYAMIIAMGRWIRDVKLYERHRNNDPPTPEKKN